MYISTSEQKTNSLTKALEKIKSKRFLNYLRFI